MNIVGNWKEGESDEVEVRVINSHSQDLMFGPAPKVGEQNVITGTLHSGLNWNIHV